MFFILKAQELFGYKFLVGGPILLYILFNIFYAIFSVPAGVISDKIGRRHVILGGYFLFFLTCLGFIFFKSLLFIASLFALYGVSTAIMDVNQRAFVSDLSKGDLKATALGAFHTIIGFITLLGNLIAGVIWQLVSPYATFIFGSLLSLSAGILLSISKNHFEPENVPHSSA